MPVTTGATQAAAPAISVVIVNWNGGEFLVRCLASLRLHARLMSMEIIVVDNGSSDGSLDACEALGGIIAIRNGRNLGFGAACNVGWRRAAGAVVLFLNPDCEVLPGSIERCVDTLQASDVGACGVALMDEHGATARSCHRFPGLANFVFRICGLHTVSQRWGDGAMTTWDHAQDADVDHVIGAFYAMRRELLVQLNGFDERFFVYLEDLDLSLRIHQSGLKIRFLATPPSFHYGGGLSRHVKARRLFYSTRSRILYAYKHFPRYQAHLHLVLTLFVEPLTRGAHGLLSASGTSLGEAMRGFAMLWRDLPAIVRASRAR